MNCAAVLGSQLPLLIKDFQGPRHAVAGKNKKKQDGEFDRREEDAIHPYMMTKLSQFANNSEDTNAKTQEGRLKTESEL